MINTAQDYTTFMDISHLHWGKPSDNKSRITMSFYIASNVITDGLEVLKQSQAFQGLLTKYQLNLTPHTLLQSDSRAIAFFCGKSPIHTWREDLRRRFRLYTEEYLRDTNAVANIFGKDMDVPQHIPFYFKVTTLRSKAVKTTAITRYVGRNHTSFMQALLKKVPFPDVQLIPLSQRRHDPEIFEKQILLHSTLCTKSSAVKLGSTSEDLRLALAQEICDDEVVGEYIINVAKASSTAVDGTLYVQHLNDQKHLAMEYLTEFLAAYLEQHPDNSDVIIVQPSRGHQSTSLVSPSPTVNTWNKFQSVIGPASIGNYSLTVPLPFQTFQSTSTCNRCSHTRQQQAINAPNLPRSALQLFCTLRHFQHAILSLIKNCRNSESKCSHSSQPPTN